MSNSSGFGLPLSALTLLALGTPAPAKAGGDLDARILGVPQVVQSIQPGTLPYIAGKPAFVRVPIVSTGTIPAGTELDGFMRVFVDGIETADSPIYSDNGPIPAKASIAPGNEDDSLNFIFLPPESTNVTLTVEINPPGPNRVFETDYSNNTGSAGPFNFQGRGIPEIVYVPIDYRPSGAGAPQNLPDPALIDPGVGDNFSQGIFPTRYGEYFPSDAPSKLWTSNVDSLFGGTGGQLLASLSTDLSLMSPQPDFIYGWIPGPLPSINGQAIGIPGDAAFGNTDPIRHQRTFAHELGHLYGLAHNSVTAGTVGVDVERHLNITQGLPRIKATNANDIMVAGLTTAEAWLGNGTNNTFFNHPSFAPAPSKVLYEEALLVSGLWNRVEREFQLIDTFALSNTRPKATVPLAEADLVLSLYAAGELFSETGIAANTTGDCGGTTDSLAGPAAVSSFVAILPVEDPNAIERLAITDARTGREVYAVERSAAAPTARFRSPAGHLVEGALEVEWEASDADGDELSFALVYSPDGERRLPLGHNLRGLRRLDVDLTSLPALRADRGYFELIASDGLRTTKVRTQALAPAQPIGQPTTEASSIDSNPPLIEIYTPDPGFAFPKGATVVLRSSGWDMEDRALSGSSIEWSSDLDGVLGTGRVTSVANLSLGAHVITATATDSDSMTTQATTTLTVVDRELPGEATCQTDLGFGGPGPSILSSCGGDLSSGNDGAIRLVCGEPSAQGWLTVGINENPTPILGGTLVPVPTILFINATIDANGEWVFPTVVGGGGPFSIFVQFAYLDANQTQGYGFSNALRLDFLP